MSSGELHRLDSVRPRHVDALRRADYGTLADLRRASVEELAAIDAIGTRTAMKIKREVGHEGGTGDGGRKFGDGELGELLDLDSINRRHAVALYRAGYETLADLRRASHADLTAVDGIGHRVAIKLGTELETGSGGDDTDSRTAAGERSGGATGTDSPRSSAGSRRVAAGDDTTGRSGGRAGPPDTVPDVGRHSLAYGDIEKGDLLGTGGNADVYRATATTGEGTVEIALKEPRVEGTLHTEAVERLLDEAERWQKLDDHDHVVGVVDYGSRPLPWIAMERMDAGELSERVGDLPLEQAVWTALATTRAVVHADARGVAHLDLKPPNVLFRHVENGWDVPKVADWGLSRHLLDHSKSVEGLTPEYAAPEQFDPESFGPVDNVTDIYQLGAVLYELFTGRPPFEGPPFEVMRKIRTGEPTPPSEIADVPAELDDIVRTAMATDREDRYEHVLYLRDDLRDLLESVRSRSG